MITVAITTYNRPNYLKLALDAIINQTYSDFELVILDNGSDNETVSVIRDFQAKDSRVTVIRNAENSKDFANEIFLLLSRKYLLWTHDDDIMKENFLEKMLFFIQKDKLDYLGCSVDYIDAEGKLVQLKEKKIIYEDLVVLKSDPIISFFNFEYPSIPTVIMNSDFLREKNVKFNLDVGPAADAYFFYESIKKGARVGKLKEVLYSYRLHSSQDSQENKFLMEIQLFNIWLSENSTNSVYMKLMFDRCFSFYQEAVVNGDDYRQLKIREFINILGNSKLTIKQCVYKIVDVNKAFILYDLLRMFRSMKIGFLHLKK